MDLMIGDLPTSGFQHNAVPPKVVAPEATQQQRNGDGNLGGERARCSLPQTCKNVGLAVIVGAVVALAVVAVQRVRCRD